MQVFSVDSLKCTKCGVCVKICPANIIKFNEKGMPEMGEKDANSCIKCGHCVLFCPSLANSLSFLKAEDLVETECLAMPGKAAGLNLLKTRRSTRCFKEEPISEEVLKEIFDAVRMAPTASNSQRVRWVLSSEREKTDEIRKLTFSWLRDELSKKPASRFFNMASYMTSKAAEGDDALLRGAPQIAFALVPKAYGWPEDGAIALTYLELAAHSVGAGVCWGGFVTTAARNYAKLRDFLGINENEHICGAQMLGYPLLKPARQFPPRKEIDITVI